MGQKNLLDLFRVFYHRKFIMLLIILSSVSTAIALSKVLPPIYKATVDLLPASQTGNQYGVSLSALGNTNSFMLPNLPKEMLKSYLGMLESMTVKEYVANNIPERTLKQIRRGAKFDINKHNLIEITVLDKDPVLAAKIANMLSESFNYFLQSITSQESKRERTFSEDQLQISHENLVKAEEALKNYKETHNISSIDEENSLLVVENAKLESELRLLMVDIEENGIELSSTEKLLAQQNKMQKYSEIIADNPIVQKLKSDLVDLEVQLAAVKTNYGDSYSTTVSLKTKVDETKNKLKAEVEKLVVSETSRIDPIYEELTQKYIELQVKDDALQARKSALDIVIKQVKDLLLKMPERSRRYASLQRDLIQAEEVYKMMALKVEDAKIDEAHKTEEIVIIDSASVPERPYFPILWINILASLGFSIIVSVFFCLLLEHVEDLRKSETSGQ